MPSLGSYILVASIAAAASFILSFPARHLAVRVGMVDQPDERRVHTQATPYGGGAAMVLAFLVAMGVASGVPGLHGVFHGSSEPLGVVIAGLVVFGVGMVDDWKSVSPPARVAVEVLAAMALYFFGVTMYQFKIPFAGFVILSSASIPLLVSLWVIGLTNALNLIDGLDGLAAGIVAIASAALTVYGLRLEHLGLLPPSNVGPLIAALAFGVSAGFLPHNFHRAKIFMGDAGALFLGLLMAAATMVIGGRAPETSGTTYFFFAPLLLPLFILGVPILDTVLAFARRILSGQSFHAADMEHLHHRLLRLGHGHRRSVLILWAWTAILSSLLLSGLFSASANAFIPTGVAALAVVLLTAFHPQVRRSAHLAGKKGKAGVGAGAERAGSGAGEVPTWVGSETGGAAVAAGAELLGSGVENGVSVGDEAGSIVGVEAGGVVIGNGRLPSGLPHDEDAVPTAVMRVQGRNRDDDIS